MTDITLTAVSPASPAPYVEVTAENFPVGAATATVWRTTAGRQFRVRGLVQVSTAGVISQRDFEAPFGVESTYRVQHFDGSGDFLSWSDAEAVTLALPSPFYAVFHNPFDPESSVVVEMLDTAASELYRPTDYELFRVKGRSVGIGIFGTRHGITKAQLDCFTSTITEANRFDALFGDYDSDTVPIVCVRTPPVMQLPQPLFAVASPSRLPSYRFRDGDEDTVWRIVGDEIAPPVEAAIVALLGYDDFTAFYADYAEFTAAYTDYREAQLDYSIAGTA